MYIIDSCLILEAASVVSVCCLGFSSKLQADIEEQQYIVFGYGFTYELFSVRKEKFSLGNCCRLYYRKGVKNNRALLPWDYIEDSDQWENSWTSGKIFNWLYLWQETCACEARMR